MARLDCYQPIPNFSFISGVLAQGAPGIAVISLSKTMVKALRVASSVSLAASSGASSGRMSAFGGDDAIGDEGQDNLGKHLLLGPISYCLLAVARQDRNDVKWNGGFI